MATTVGALSVDLDLNSASFINNMKKATDTVDRSAKSMEKSMKMGKNAVQGLLAAFTVGAIKDTVSRALDYVSALGEQAQQVGVTTKALQEYRYMASQVGISNEEIEKGLAKLNLKLGQAADPASKAGDTFRALGISILDSTGHVRSADNVFQDLQAKLSLIPDSARRSRIEVELFGKTGQKLDTLLNGSNGKVAELAAAAEKLGIVLSDDEIQRADTTADKIGALKKVLEANISGVVAKNAESILILSSALLTTASSVTRFLGSNPQGALTILGALAGARFGPIGAGIGAVTGYVTGASTRAIADDASMDPKYRQKRLKEARAELAQRMTPTDPTSLVTIRHQKNWSSGTGLADATKEVYRQQALFRQSLAAGKTKPLVDIPIPTTPIVGGKGGGSKGGGGSRSSGPTIADQFATMEGSLDPLKRANDEYAKTNLLLNQAEAAGLKAAHGFDALHDAAKHNLMDDLHLEELPLELAETDSLVGDLTIKMDDLTASIPEFGSVLGSAFKTAKEAGMDGLIDGLENLRQGFGSLKDVALSVLESIESALLQTLVYGPLKDWASGGGGGIGGLFGGLFGGGSKSGGGGGLFSAIGSLFGGGKATGGAVNSSQFYLVGEDGPELFAPGANGAIIPNAVLRGGGGFQQRQGDVHMNFYGPVSNAEQVRRSGAQVGAGLLRMTASGKRGI